MCGWLTDDYLPKIGQYPNLKVLSLAWTGITDDGIRNIVKAHPKLRYLHLAHVEGVTSRSVPELAKLKDLKYIHVGETALMDQGYGDKNAIDELKKRLPNCYVDSYDDLPKPEKPEDWASLIGVSDPIAPNDTLLAWQMPLGPHAVSRQSRLDQNEFDRLYVGGAFDCTPFILDEKLIQVLSKAGDLKWLNVGVDVKAEDLRWICKLSTLRGISLGGADLREADLECLRNLKHLQWLDLLGATLPNPEVSRLPDFPELEVLFFEAQDVTDDHLPEIGQYPILKVLGLSRTDITDRGIRKIVQAHPKLRFLHLVDVRGVTNRSVPELGKLKELKFMHVGGTALIEQDYGDNYALHELKRLLPNCYISIEH
jgi:hypothetical protein